MNLKGHRINSGSDSRPIIGSDFWANITIELDLYETRQRRIFEVADFESKVKIWKFQMM